jgi:hypothetical protein
MITVLFHNVAIGIMVCYARECYQGSRSDGLKLFRFLKNSHLSVPYVSLVIDVHAMTKYLIVHKTFPCDVKIHQVIVTCISSVCGTWCTLIFTLCISKLCQLKIRSSP